MHTFFRPGSSWNVLTYYVSSIGRLSKQTFNPLEFFLGYLAYIFNDLFLVERKSVESKKWEFIGNVNFVIATFHKSFIDLGCEPLVCRVVVEPKLIHEFVEALGLFWWGDIVVEWGIIVSKCEEHWCLGHVFSKQGLNLSVSKSKFTISGIEFFLIYFLHMFGFYCVSVSS